MKFLRLFLCAASCIAVATFRAPLSAADARGELVSKLNFALRSHDAKAFMQCVNFTGADEAMTKQLVALIGTLVKGPQVEISTVPLFAVGDSAWTIQEPLMLNGPCDSLVKIGSLQFCTGTVNGQYLILLPLKPAYGRIVPGKPDVVLSPYNRNGHLIEVKGLAQGTVITDIGEDRPFLVPASNVYGGKVEPEGEIIVEASEDGVTPAYRMKPYYTREHLKPLRVDIRDASGKFTGIRIYLQRLLLVFSLDGQVKTARPYEKADFLNDAEWKVQLQVEGRQE